MLEFKMRISIVLACHESDERLWQTLSSLASQERLHSSTSQCGYLSLGSHEFIVVHDGPPSDFFHAKLEQWMREYPSHKLIVQPKAGLTQALIRACSVARGDLIARIDVGDVMAPSRLRRQLDFLSRHPNCVLATSHVEVCGPRWESLWINRGSGSQQGDPWRVDRCAPEQGIAMDIPHHASVTFRRSAYEAVGGYRPEFYFGQDWDLWYRLASQGPFVHIPEVLTRVRLFPGGISSRHWREQRAIAELSLACHVARSRGESELPLLKKAAAIRPKPGLPRKPLVDGARAEGAYFIAEALRRNRDRRCWRYFREALCHGFWKPRIWVRALHALFVPAT
jgi:glycosyltransferase involved in cell wall biosynthesis